MTVAFTSTDKAVLQAAREYLIEKGYADDYPWNERLLRERPVNFVILYPNARLIVFSEYTPHNQHGEEIEQFPITPEDYKHIIDKELWKERT